MKLVFFLIATSALFTVAAIPMMVSFGSSSPSSPPSPPSEPPVPYQVPTVSFGHRIASRNDKNSARVMMVDHYLGLEPWNQQKQAKLAFADHGWRDGKGPDDEHKQYLDFTYHKGEQPRSAKIGQTVTVSRDRPLPEPHFTYSIPKEHKAEMAKEMEKKYNALPPDQAKRVRSMRAHGDWADGPGLREQTQFSYHYSPTPTKANKFGDPVTIYRPMSFLMDAPVPKADIPGIKKRVREEHDKLDENHPLKQANYGVVTHGWQRVPGSADRQVGTMLYKVKDKLSDSHDDGFEKIGDFPVTLKNSASSSSSRI